MKLADMLPPEQKPPAQLPPAEPTADLTVLPKGEGPDTDKMKEAAPLAVYDPLRAQYAEKLALAVALLKTEVTPENCKALEPSFKRMRLDFVPVRTGTDKVRKGRNADKQKEIYENNRAAFEIMRLCEEIEAKLLEKETFAATEQARLAKIRGKERAEELEALGVDPATMYGLAGMPDEQWQMVKAGAVAAKAKREEEAAKEKRWQERRKILIPWEPFVQQGDADSDEIAGMNDDEFSAVLEVLRIRKDRKEGEARKAEEARIAREKAEAEAREAQRLENERLRKEAEEREAQALRERQAAAAALEREKRLAEEALNRAKAEREAAHAKERAESDARIAAIEAENERQRAKDAAEARKRQEEAEAKARKDALAAQQALAKQREVMEAKRRLRISREDEARDFAAAREIIKPGTDLSELSERDWSDLYERIKDAQADADKKAAEEKKKQEANALLVKQADAIRSAAEAEKRRKADEAAALAAAGDREKLLHFKASILAVPRPELSDKALAGSIADQHHKFGVWLDKCAGSLKTKPETQELL